MRSCKYISLFILQFSLYTICTAQNQLTFNLVPPPIGLHPGSKAGIQDQQGYMWIGTYQAPLRRYEGYHYTFYSNDPSDSNSLAQNWVEALCAAKDGAIWIGTPNEGLDRFDPATGKFKHYYHESNGPNSLSCNQVEKIYEDRQGTIWVGTGSAWYDEGGQTDEGGLNRFDKKTGKFIRYLHDPKNPHTLINNKVKAIFEDSRGTFWVGTAGDGLHTMNKEKGTFDRHLYDPAHPGKLSRPPQKKIRPYADDHITFIIEDAAGEIWIGTFGNGLNRYDPKTKKVTHYPLFKDPVSGMLLEVPWWACTSRDGMLWIGYWRGLYQTDPLRRNIPYVTTGTSVDEIYEDRFLSCWGLLLVLLGSPCIAL